MHSSEHGKKKIAGFLVCIAVFMIVCVLLDIALYPCTYMRNDVHAVTTEHHDVIFLGTSNGKMNLDPDTVLQGTGLSGHNLCNGNQYPLDSYYLLKLVLEKQKPSCLVYELDPNVYVTEKEKGNNYLLFYHEFPLSLAKLQYFFDAVASCDFRTLFFPFYEYPLSAELPRVRDNLRRKLSGDYDIAHLQGESAAYHENGFMERFPVDESRFASINTRRFRTEDVNAQNVKDLGRIVSLCEEEGVELIVIMSPQTDVALEMFSAEYAEAEAYFSAYFASRGISYYNFNTEYYDACSHDVTRYVDYNGHMNGDGARAFSAACGALLFGDL